VRKDADETDPAAPADVKPWQRPAEPDHPLIVEGEVVPGDTRFMACCMLEELMTCGIAADELRRMSHDANYQALFAARLTLGDAEFDRLLSQVTARVGVLRVTVRERSDPSHPATLTVNGGPCGRGSAAPVERSF
jgi:hypothetical protein